MREAYTKRHKKISYIQYQSEIAIHLLVSKALAKQKKTSKVKNQATKKKTLETTSKIKITLGILQIIIGQHSHSQKTVSGTR